MADRYGHGHCHGSRLFQFSGLFDRVPISRPSGPSASRFVSSLHPMQAQVKRPSQLGVLEDNPESGGAAAEAPITK